MDVLFSHELPSGHHQSTAERMPLPCKGNVQCKLRISRLPDQKPTGRAPVSVTSDGRLTFTVKMAPPSKAEPDIKQAPDHRFIAGDQELFLAA